MGRFVYHTALQLLFKSSLCKQQRTKATPLKTYPWGFPGLEGLALADCELGNKFIKLTHKALDLCYTLDIGRLLEHPEDLGATYAGDLPRSIWAIDSTFELANRIGAVTAASFQCRIGGETSKPTRVGNYSSKWPQFTTTGRYLGPLPAKCGHHYKPVISKAGNFGTAASASYPALKCKWIANLVVSCVF